MRIPLWLVCGWILVLGTARLIPHLPIGLPRCGLRTLTGIPCPLCGTTRTLTAWSQFQFAEAFRFNPLVAAACIVFCVMLVLYALDCWLGRGWTLRLWQQLRRKPWPWLLLAIVFANWIYLVLRLPK